MVKSRVYQVRITTPHDEFSGTFYSPYPNRRLAEVLGKLEGYINLKDVTNHRTDTQYPFILVNKASIETISVVKEFVVDE